MRRGHASKLAKYIREQRASVGPCRICYFRVSHHSANNHTREVEIGQGAIYGKHLIKGEPHAGSSDHTAQCRIYCISLLLLPVHYKARARESLWLKYTHI